MRFFCFFAVCGLKCESYAMQLTEKCSMNCKPYFTQNGELEKKTNKANEYDVIDVQLMYKYSRMTNIYWNSVYVIAQKMILPDFSNRIVFITKQ